VNIHYHADAPMAGDSSLCHRKRGAVTTVIFIAARGSRRRAS
jgi:hypothetical protein